MNITQWQHAVTEFHLKMRIGSRLKPDQKDPKLCDQVPRSLLILEEGTEATIAILRDDLTESVDGLIDLIYVSLGSLDRWGVSANAILSTLNSEIGISEDPAHSTHFINGKHTAEEILGCTVDVVTSILVGDLEEAEARIYDVLSSSLLALLDWGVNPEPMFAEVHRTNMLKGAGKFNSATGKILKPANWVPPRINMLLGEQGAWA